MNIREHMLSMLTAFVAVGVEMYSGAVSIGVITDQVEYQYYSYFDTILIRKEYPNPIYCAWLTVAFIGIVMGLLLIHNSRLKMLMHGAGVLVLAGAIWESIAVFGYDNTTPFSYAICIILVVTCIVFLCEIGKEVRKRNDAIR